MEPEWEQLGRNPCTLLLQKRDPEVLLLILSLLQSKMVILRVVKKRGWFVIDSIQPMRSYLPRKLSSTTQNQALRKPVSCRNTSFAFLSQLTAMHVDSHQYLVLKKLFKSIINIKHQSILASFPENKLQKVISKKDIKALGRTDTGMSSDVVL